MSITLLQGDCRELLDTLPAASIQTIVTSPPYWRLRRYTNDPREIGQEPTAAAYVAALVDVFERCRRVLRDDGTIWINIGDAYTNDTKWGGRSGGKNYTSAAGGCEGQRTKGSTVLPPKSLIGLPWRVAFALQDAGWVLRNEIIWHKPNAMPESVADRCARDHETLFLFSKGPRYYFDQDAIAEPVKRTDRPQYMRAVEIAQENGLTNQHIDAIRAVGITDVGKARITQSGAGKNDPLVQALADEAKRVLKGYYREFLTTRAADSFKRNGNKRSTAAVPGNTATHRADRPDVAHSGITRNPRTVWSICTEQLSDDHYAPMPQALAERCIKAGSRPGDTVLDPFAGSGTTGRAAIALQRQAILIDLAYSDLQERRTDGVQVQMVELL